MRQFQHVPCRSGRPAPNSVRAFKHYFKSSVFGRVAERVVGVQDVVQREAVRH